MTEPEQTSPEGKRSPPGCAVAILLCLICYVFSYPWVSAAIWRFRSPSDETVRSIANVMYAPVAFAIEHDRAVFVFYRWYTETLNETFPSFFEVPILVVDPSEISLIQIDPPPGVPGGESLKSGSNRMLKRPPGVTQQSAQRPM